MRSLRSAGRVGAAIVVAASLGLLFGLPANADLVGPGATVTSSGPVVEVTVSGSGYLGGSPGSGSVGREPVSVRVPCWMEAWLTGKAFYEYRDSGLFAQQNPTRGDPVTDYAGWETHKDDDLGHWYVTSCAGANWPDPSGVGFPEFTNQFYASHRPLYVPAGQEPPVPPVPPEVLRDVAINNLTLPDPQLDWNPKRVGNDGTLVNLDTWFWLNNPPPNTLEVRASVPGTWAGVTATFKGMGITAPGETALSCPGSGTAYTPGARTTTCALAFSRASSALGAQATPVTVNTRWTGTWEANGAYQGPITIDPVTATTDILVDEVQTLVIGAR